MLTRDDRITLFRQGLHRLYLPIFDFLCDNLPGEWAPCQGFRSIQAQQDLYEVGRLSIGKVVTNAKGGDSAHNWGCASDWVKFINGIPIWDAPDSEWQFYGDMVRRAKGEWAGDWLRFKEKDHNQLALNVPYEKVGDVYRAQGRAAALKYLEGNKTPMQG